MVEEAVGLLIEDLRGAVCRLAVVLDELCVVVLDHERVKQTARALSLFFYVNAIGYSNSLLSLPIVLSLEFCFKYSANMHAL